MRGYGRDYGRDRVWYGGGGLEDGDSDVEFGYSARGFGRGNYGGRSRPAGGGEGPLSYGPGGYYGASNYGGGSRAPASPEPRADSHRSPGREHG
jgi:hypothetical protein